ncbi:MAG: hypothetical protein WC780_08735 [Lentimicrobiaceae bacterium]|jgi:tetratricopeptide (TPR) repeat protein
MKNCISRKAFNLYVWLVVIGTAFLPFLNNPCSAQSTTNAAAYSTLIQQADQALTAKDYPVALLLYAKASHANPALNYAPGKIDEINATLDANPGSRDRLFENLILAAEGLYNQKNYSQAKTEYQKALLIDPSAQFPKDRLGQISAIYTDPDDLIYFNEAVTSGDKALAASDFDKAVMFYETALAVKPGEKSVKNKISDTRKQQADYKVRAEQSAKNIAAADKLLQAEKRTEARAEYQKALDLTPGNPYAKLKIQEIDKFINEEKSLQDTYDKSIDQADQFYINRDFTNARLKYQEALKAKPGARYPNDMLEKTKSGESQLQSDQQKYDATLASAENFLQAADYQAALIGFKSALAIKPAENYPKTKITEIEKLIAGQSAKKEAFDLAVRNGDQSLVDKKYDVAISYYRNALSLLPGEKYPAQKIEEITTLTGQQKTLDEKYLKAIAEADKQFNAGNFEVAVPAYNQALGFKPNEVYPQQKINEAQSRIAATKNTEANYTSSVASGDKLFSELKYNDALDAYKQALSLKPEEKYPQTQLDRINKILAEQKSNNEQYSKAIANGEKELASVNYSLAIASFQEALSVKPGEKYPQDKIAEIKAAIAAQQKTDEKYTTAVNSGDQLFAGKDYDLAKTAYSEAAGLKKNEKYPQEQIVKINKIFDELHSAEENYKQAIDEGDNSFKNQRLNEAIASYTKASGIKPAETYPKTQVEKIKVLLAEQQKLDADFLDKVTSADQFFDAKRYAEAIIDYRKALALKPSEKYPSEKIAEAEKQIADLEALQLTFEKAVAEGDKKLAGKQYESALSEFKTALSAKPGELYPQQKIAEIQSILDKIKAENESYTEAISKGDTYLKAGKNHEALEIYQLASTLKPGEKYPREQIAHINQLLAEQEKLDTDYQNLITDANTRLKAGKYDEARIAYTNAGALKPSEKLPKEKITEIDTILAGIKLKDENYAEALNKAADLYSAKNLAGAVKSYEEALGIKPAEKYPQERIAVLKSEIQALDENYSKAIALGDKQLAANNLMNALNAYQNALEIKPGEEYPRSKIAEINSALVAQKEELAKMYNSYISEGDKSFESKDYAGAKSAFTKAAGIKPAETYPKQRITEIDKITEEIALARKVEYTKALGEADKLYNTKIFDQAIDAYENASKINPGDTYPSLQISKIRKYMEDHAIQDLYSQTLLIPEGSEKKFTFSAIEPRLRKNNYILLKARSTGKAAPKVYLNYGKDSQKNGGIVLRSLDKTTLNDYLIRISVQDKWYREDNNWISLFVETGDIEITKIQIAAGDE